LEYVPSLHFAVAPVGSVLPVVDLEVDAVDLGAVVVGAAAFIAEPLEGTLEAGGVAAGADVLLDLEAFCTPPWPLQAPRPLAVEVLPSLQVVGAAAGAWATAVSTAKLAAIKIRQGTIIRARGKVFIGFAPRFGYDSGCPATA
jgi:hypothetical protein